MVIKGKAGSIGLNSLQASLFPLSIGLTVALMYFAPFWGMPLSATQMTVFIAAIAAGVLAERCLPHQNEWRKSVDRDTRIDASTFGTMLFVVDPFIKAVSPAVAAALLVFLIDPGSFRLVPESWHFLIQLVIAAIIAEFGPYWMHRRAHRGGWLWRVHSIHHSSSRIYWLNSYRAHPLNIIWHYFSGPFALLLLGFPTHVIQTYFALAAVVSVFQHCNAQLRLGWLNYIFSTNEVHRWHHSTKMKEANNNYGNVLMIWDLLFGTFYYKPGRAPERVGLSGPQTLPTQSFWRLMAWPFRNSK